MVGIKREVLSDGTILLAPGYGLVTAGDGEERKKACWTMCVKLGAS
jgi:hypothetical protein